MRKVNMKPGKIILIFYLALGILALIPLQTKAQIHVNQNGDVGIGTETPSTKLDINGGLRWREATTAGNVVIVEDADGNLTTVSINTLIAQAAGDPESNIFYVSRRFTGYANASNPAYTEQLNQAIRGDLTFTYPDPWSARDAAIAAIAANEIPNAIIYVLAGQQYTYGDQSNANNGAADFSGSAFEVDKKTTSATKAEINLYHEGIRYYFDKNAGLSNHCKTYPIPLVSVTGETAKTFELFGEGDFYNYYGQSMGWNLEFVKIDNPQSTFRFIANSVNMQQWLVFDLTRTKRFDIQLETAILAGCSLVSCVNITSIQPILGSIRVNNIFNGEGVFGPYVDFWYLFVLKNAGPADIAVEVNNIRTKESGPIFYSNDPTSYNKLSLHIKNIEFTVSSAFGHLANLNNNCAFQIGDDLPGALVPVEIGNSFNIRVDNYLGDMPFLTYRGMNKKDGSKNNVFDVFCGNCLIKDAGQSAIQLWGGSGFNGVNPDGSLLKLRGAYRTLSGPVINALTTTSNVEIDASLSSEYAPGLFTAGTNNVNSITLSATAYPQTPGVVFQTGSNLPNIRKLTLWDKTTKQYADATPVNSGSITLSGDVTGPINNTQIAPNTVGPDELVNTGIAPGNYPSTYALPVLTIDADGRITSVTEVPITGGAPSGPASGDLSGSYPSPTVDGLQGNPVSATTPAAGQVLKWNGSAWAPAADNNTTYTAGTGINFNGSIIENTGDLSATNEIQDLSLSSNTLSLSNDPTTVNLAPYLDNTDAQTLSVVGSNLSISGGNTITLPVAPVSSVNGLTGTVALDLSLAGSTLSLTGDPTTVTLPDASSTNELQTLTTASNTVTLSNAGGSFTLAGAGLNTVSTVGNIITVTGTDVTTNEGVLGVGAGTATTSIITSNSSGATGVTLTAGSGITLTETASTNGGNITIASTGGGSNWTVSGADIYRNSNVAIGTTLTTGAKLSVEGVTAGTCLRTTAGTAVPAFGAIIKSTGTSTGSFYGIDIDASATGNTLHRFRNSNNGATSNNSVVQIEVGGSAGGDPVVQFAIPSEQTWVVGSDNSDNNTFKIQPGTALSNTTQTGVSVNTAGKVGLNKVVPFVTLDAATNTDAIALPMGTSANRPGSVAGDPRLPFIRYNTTFNGYEVKDAHPTSELSWRRLTCMTVPTAVLGTGAGTSPSSVTINGTDLKGTISFTTGTTPASGATIATITFGSPFFSSPSVILTPGNSNAALVVTKYFVGPAGGSSFVISASAGNALSASTPYVFNYQVMD